MNCDRYRKERQTIKINVSDDFKQKYLEYLNTRGLTSKEFLQKLITEKIEPAN